MSEEEQKLLSDQMDKMSQLMEQKRAEFNCQDEDVDLDLDDDIDINLDAEME